MHETKMYVTTTSRQAKEKRILTKIEAVSYWARILKQVYYNKTKKSIKLLNKKLWLTWFVELLKLYTQLLTIAAYSQKPFEKKALLHQFKAHLITISRGDALPDLLGRLKIIYHHHVLVNEGKQIQDASKKLLYFFRFSSFSFFFIHSSNLSDYSKIIGQFVKI